MKTLFGTNKLFLLLLTLSFLMSSCGELVRPNYIGVLQENYGKNGKRDFSIVNGRINTMGMGTELYQVPVWEQTAYFEKELHLKAADNTEFTANPKYKYQINPDRAIDVIFANRQLGSGDTFMKSLEDIVLEMSIYDIVKESSRSHVTDTLMATKGSLKLEREVENLVKADFEKRGIMLLNFSLNLDFSDKVKNKIDQRNEVNTNVSVIDQKILEQKKVNELEALKTEQKLIESKGITREILMREWIQKWDGKVPTTTTGNGNVMFSIPIDK
jgi:hypothetical protein